MVFDFGAHFSFAYYALESNFPNPNEWYSMRHRLLIKGFLNIPCFNNDFFPLLLIYFAESKSNTKNTLPM